MATSTYIFTWKQRLKFQVMPEVWTFSFHQTRKSIVRYFGAAISELRCLEIYGEVTTHIRWIVVRPPPQNLLFT
jgi:hypothetical protein